MYRPSGLRNSCIDTLYRVELFSRSRFALVELTVVVSPYSTHAVAAFSLAPWLHLGRGLAEVPTVRGC